LDLHVILVNDLLFGLSFLCDCGHAVNPVVKPCARDSLSVLVSQLSIPMFDVVDPLTFKLNTICRHVESITVSD